MSGKGSFFCIDFKILAILLLFLLTN